MNTVNERILSDTRGSLFVTTLLAVLEPHTGRMVYANAGHPPAFLIGARNGKASIEALKPTGMVLGVEPSSWKQKSIRIAPGDLLVLYSDGITEIQDPQGNLFGEEGLLDVLLTHQNSSVQRIKSAVIEALQKFAGSPVRQDDIALLVLRRNA
jgi:sigma-B regulation protein RsbU (phosphoserine phosphatase)